MAPPPASGALPAVHVNIVCNVTELLPKNNMNASQEKKSRGRRAYQSEDSLVSRKWRSPFCFSSCPNVKPEETANAEEVDGYAFFWGGGGGDAEDKFQDMARQKDKENKDIDKTERHNFLVFCMGLPSVSVVGYLIPPTVFAFLSFSSIFASLVCDLSSFVVFRVSSLVLRLLVFRL